MATVTPDWLPPADKDCPMCRRPFMSERNHPLTAIGRKLKRDTFTRYSGSSPEDH